MTGHLQDQYEAARQQARATVAGALGVDPDYRTPIDPARGSLAEDMYLKLRDHPRCQHLVAAPVQPAYWGSIAGWECQACSQETSLWRRSLGPGVPLLGVLEEFSCDRCRRYTPGDLDTVVCRLDIWTMILSCCGRCAGEFTAFGALEVTPPDGS